MGALCIPGVLAVTNTLVAAVGIHGAAKWEHGAGPLVPWDMPLFGIPEHSGLKSQGSLSLLGRSLGVKAMAQVPGVSASRVGNLAGVWGSRLLASAWPSAGC